MKLFRLTAAAIACLALAQTALIAEDAKKADPREDVETAVDEAIRLIEAKEYEALIKNFLTPVDLSSLSSSPGLPTVVQIFAQQRSADSLKALKQAQGVKPEISEDGKIATYKLKKPINGVDSFRFVKFDKYWYFDRQN